MNVYPYYFPINCQNFGSVGVPFQFRPARKVHKISLSFFVNSCIKIEIFKNSSMFFLGDGGEE